MKMREVCRTYEIRNGRRWEETYRTTDEKLVYRGLAAALIAKKLNNCRYITRIVRQPLYDGFSKITVSYDNGGRDIFIVED